MPYWTKIIGGIKEAREKQREAEEPIRETEREKERLRFAFGLERPLKERELSLQERQLKQQTIDNAYGRAQDIASDYLETPDPDDKNPSVTARALAAEAFDNFMASAGYSDITFLGQTQPERVEAEKPEVTPPRRPLLPPTKPILPPTAPKEARVAERGGQIVEKGVEAVSKLPSQAVGLGSTLYNILAGGITGATGIPQKTITQPYLDVMRRGELFNIPNALKYYMGLMQKKEPPYKKQLERRIIR